MVGRLKKARTCESCRAYAGGFRAPCDLGFKVRMVLESNVPFHFPDEPCLKPRTYAEMISAEQYQQEAKSKDAK